MAIQRSWWGLVLVVLFASCGQQTKSSEENKIEVTGAQLYSENCVICHGDDGKAGISGASDLSISELDEDSVRQYILKGKKSMPPFSFLFEEDKESLNRVVEHVESLRAK